MLLKSEKDRRRNPWDDTQTRVLRISHDRADHRLNIDICQRAYGSLYPSYLENPSGREGKQPWVNGLRP